MADPVQEQINHRKLGVWDYVEKGYHPEREVDFKDNRITQLFRDSLAGDVLSQITGGPESDWAKVMWNQGENKDARLRDKVAYTAARVGRDLMFDGSRTPYWLLNHPLAGLSILSQMGSTAAGLTPNYRQMHKEMKKQGAPDPTRAQIDAEFARRMEFRHSGVEPPDGAPRRGLPSGVAAGVMPLLAATAMVEASGNHDLMNLAQGGRTKGYAAVLPKNGSLTETSNIPLELLLRYVVGRSGRLLPWEQFTQERPDVSPEDYAGARRDQFDRGPLGIGLIKGTTRNLNGEPEYTMMGFRVPMSAAATGLGAIGGGIAGSRLADHVIGEHLRKQQAAGVLADLPQGNLSLRAQGNRRLIGAILGALTGAGVSRATSEVVNDRIVQPALHPDRVAAEQRWLATAPGRTLEERVKALAPEPRTPGEELPDLQRRQQNQQQNQQQMQGP
jgi:hypothetical protein